MGSKLGTTKIFVVDSDPDQNLIIGAGTNDVNLLNTNDGVERPLLAFFSSKLHFIWVKRIFANNANRPSSVKFNY